MDENNSMIQHCPSCNAEIAENQISCPACGAELKKSNLSAQNLEQDTETKETAEDHIEVEHIEIHEDKICPVCHTHVKYEFKFCNKCGADLIKPIQETNKAETPPPRTEYHYTSPAKPIGKACPNCNLVVHPGVSVCPRCGKPLPLPRVSNKSSKTVFRPLSVISYAIAGFLLLIGLINLASVGLSQYNIFGSGNTTALLASITTCLFMAVSSLIFTVLGSAFLIVFKQQK